MCIIFLAGSTHTKLINLIKGRITCEIHRIKYFFFFILFRIITQGSLCIGQEIFCRRINLPLYLILGWCIKGKIRQYHATANNNLFAFTKALKGMTQQLGNSRQACRTSTAKDRAYQEYTSCKASLYILIHPILQPRPHFSFNGIIPITEINLLGNNSCADGRMSTETFIQQGSSLFLGIQCLIKMPNRFFLISLIAHNIIKALVVFRRVPCKRFRQHNLGPE